MQGMMVTIPQWFYRHPHLCEKLAISIVENLDHLNAYALKNIINILLQSASFSEDGALSVT